MNILSRLKQSKLFKDAFWAIMGNGLSNALLLIAGIIIARLLGKDVYGEYGVVKSTMLAMGGFATLSLSITSTKFVADAVTNKPREVKRTIIDSLYITLYTSLVFAVLIGVFARPIAIFLEDVNLVVPLRFLAFIIIFNSISRTNAGILGGLKNYKLLAKNNVIASESMILTAVPLTYYFGINGSLVSLLTSQVLNSVLNTYSIYKITHGLEDQIVESKKKSMIYFSLPVTLQESTYMVCNWGGTIIMTKLANIGQIGIFTATSQWNSVVLMIPGLLVNVILSHLSSTVNQTDQHNNVMRRMLMVNFGCTLVPFIIVYFLAPWIVSFYGPSFGSMVDVMRVLLFSTIFVCCSNVFNSEFIAIGKTWALFAMRFVRDVSLLALSCLLIIKFGADTGALDYAWASVITSVLYFVGLLCAYRYLERRKTKIESQVNGIIQ